MKSSLVIRGLVLLAILAMGLALATPRILDRPDVQRWIVTRAMERNLAKMAAAKASFGAEELRVILCGTASPLPNRERAGPCAAIIAGGHVHVVDAGGGGWRNLMLWQVPPGQVQSVFLTHFHSDHIQDLGEVNLQTWGQGRPASLQVYGGPGVERVVGGFNEAYAQDQTYRIAHHGPQVMVPEVFAMTPRPIVNASGAALEEGETAIVFERDGLTVTAIGVNHFPVKPAYGYRFDYKGRSVVISGDTRYSEALARAARGADVIVHEAQAQEAVGRMHDMLAAAGQDRLAHIMADIPSYHTAPLEAAAVANQAGARLLVLTHLTPPVPWWLAEHLFLAGMDAVRPKGVLLGRDGVMVSLPAGGDAVNVTNLWDQ